MDYIFDENDILFRFIKISHMLKRLTQNKLKKCGITFEQWYILYFIHQNEGCNQNMLSKSTKKDTGAMTRSLNTLQKMGLIERKISYKDKREFLIYLTDNSKELYKEISELMLQNSKEIKSIFTESEFEQLNYLLDKLNSNLE
ncbi:MarR family transcriptional regulator [Methanobrevibacter sp. TMH8]|uniref:MarR family winged helix-turn-helix transcriptional regulator n=1 Tax=Methanobrevibacter sp. TMH8 TaxID=2848611 RepID=UPI001CCA1FCB|nr:MarR family transcriptional regulator [Methanobrevibacter sp. TMH8]MBZ9571646.1 MarR family transcriptional regulator [Methanobrevibacter sp. TMH8]